jgi:hypothetical protein
MPRVKKFEPEDEEQDIYDDLCEILHNGYCSIPGCRARLHLGEAREIIEALKARGHLQSLAVSN